MRKIRKPVYIKNFFFSSSEKRKTKKFHLIVPIIFILMLSVLSVNVYAQLEFTFKECSGSQICDKILSCDFTGCNEDLKSCEDCSSTTIACSDGTQASCQNTCNPSFPTPSCTGCTPTCTSETQVIVLPFDVTTVSEVGIIVSPQEQFGLLGSTLDYDLRIENTNSVPVTLTSEIYGLTPGWTATFTNPVDIQARDTYEETIRITSPSDGTSTGMIYRATHEGEEYDSNQFVYKIVSAQDPDVTIDNPRQEGSPEHTLTYTVNVKNNDPEATSFSLTANVPSGWQTSFLPSTLYIQPGETTSSDLRVTSPSDATGGEEVDIVVEVSSSRSTVTANAIYVVLACGNNICDAGERNSCPDDCPDSEFICPEGGCDTTGEYTVDFSTQISGFVYTKFVVCKKDSSSSSCEDDFDSAQCGIDEDCLCGSNSISACPVECSDARGAYYLYARGTSGTIRSANYDFVCPELNLDQLMVIRNNFASALNEYEKGQSALLEKSRQEEGYESCYQGVGEMIGIISPYIEEMNAVIEAPTRPAVQQAINKKDSVASSVGSVYSTACRDVGVI